MIVRKSQWVCRESQHQPFVSLRVWASKQQKLLGSRDAHCAGFEVVVRVLIVNLLRIQICFDSHGPLLQLRTS